MNNYSIKIDVLKIKGAFLTNIKGKVTKKCLVIPVDSPDFYEGEKTLSLNMVAFELQNPKFEDTHMVKASIKKEVYDAMTKEEKEGQPILGGLKPFLSQHTPIAVNTTAEPENTDDLPF